MNGVDLVFSSGILLLLSTKSTHIFSNHNFDNLPQKNHLICQESLKELCYESLRTTRPISKEILSGTFPERTFRIDVFSVPKGVILIGVEVTLLKQKEERLKNTKFSFEKNQSQDLVGIWEWDLITNNIFWSGQLYQIFGVSPDSYTPSFENNLKLLHPDDAKSVSENITFSIENRKSLSFDQRMMRTDGSLRILHSWGNPIIENNKVTAYVGVCQDITNRILNDEKIRTQDQVYEKMFENFGEGIWIIDEFDNTTMVNKKMEEMLGYEHSEMLGQSMHQFTDVQGSIVANRNIERRRSGITSNTSSS